MTDKNLTTSEIELPSLKCIIILYALLAVAAYLTYFAPGDVNVFFLLLLGIFFFSNNDYFWFSFFFVVTQEPGYFFAYASSSHLPLIKLTSGISLNPVDLFSALAFLKVILRRQNRKHLIPLPVLLLMFYFIATFFYSRVILSVSWKTLFCFVRPVFYYSWLICFLSLVATPKNVFKFLWLVFPVSFFILYSQFYYLTNGQEIINLFDSEVGSWFIPNTLTGELRPVMGGVLLVFISYIGAIIFLQFKQKALAKWYLYSVMITCSIGIFISATRVWFGIFLFIFGGVYFRKAKNLPKVALIIILISVVFISLIKFHIVTEGFLKESSWGRISQVFDFIRHKEIDTYQSRLYQLEDMLDLIKKNFMFGYGFSEVSLESYNSNWGFWNTVLMFGVSGLALFIFLILFYFKTMLNTLYSGSTENSWRATIVVLLVSFAAIVIAYSFTWDFFSVYAPYIVVFLMVFFAISQIFASQLRNHTAI